MLIDITPSMARRGILLENHAGLIESEIFKSGCRFGFHTEETLSGETF